MDALTVQAAQITRRTVINSMGSLDNAVRRRQAQGVAEFAEYLYRRALEGLLTLDANERADTYVVSFFICDEDDDPRLPTLTVGTNTESQVRLATEQPADFVKPNPWWTPTDEQEARWNYAFWLQNDLAVIGEQTVDPFGAQLRRSWLEGRGLWFDSLDHSDAETAREAAITQAFVELCVATVQELHRSQALDDLFGRSIPVIVHELEYYDAIAVQNREANGEALASGLTRWIEAM